MSAKKRVSGRKPSQTGGLGERAGSGIPGLDDILGGGLPRNRFHLVQGLTGTGKTTLGLQFLLEGVRRGERALFVALSESAEELGEVVRSHGWSLDGIEIHEPLSNVDTALDEESTLFNPSEVELSETATTLISRIEASKPDRLVFDSLSELRMLAQSAYRYRRLIHALKTYFASHRCTSLFIDDIGASSSDLRLQTVAHGVIELDSILPVYGAERRRIRIIKMRAVRYRGGFHELTIETGGIRVFPRLVAAEHPQSFERVPALSGVAGLDEVLGGGLDRGTTTLFLGAAGTGKSTLALQYAVAGASRGEKSAFFVFDESLNTLFLRASGLGVDLKSHVDSQRIDITAVDPAELAPGALVQKVRDGIEKDGVRVVVIDSLNGYLASLPGEEYLTVHLHELLGFLRLKGIVTILVVSQHGLFGANMQNPIDISYLADSVVLLRHFEARGQVRKALSVVKKRSGRHETTIRELAMSAKGVELGRPLDDFQGILTGVPTFVGTRGSLLGKKETDGPGLA